MPQENVIIEATLHELVPKSFNPNVPYGPEEVAVDAAACVRAGLSFLHFHARDPQTGEQRWLDAGLYAEAILRMRELGVPADLPWYPTYRGLRPGMANEESLHHLSVLSKAPVGLQMAAIDVGSVNLSPYNAETKQFLLADSVKALPHSLAQYFFEVCRELRLRPYLGIYEPGQLRHLATYLDLGWLEPPLVMKFFFSEHHPYGMPPLPRGVEMYAEILDMVLPGVETVWFVQCYGHAIWDLAKTAIGLGGNVRVGLGDYHPWYWPDPTGEQPTNAEIVARTAEIVRSLGREIASPSEARALFRLPSR